MENTYVAEFSGPYSEPSQATKFEQFMEIVCLTVSNVLNNIVFIFIAAAFKKSIDEFICKPKPFSLFITFLIFFPFPSLFFSSFLCISPKHYCVTRMFFNEIFYFRAFYDSNRVWSRKGKFYHKKEDMRELRTSALNIKLTTCLMCHASLHHNIEVCMTFKF